MISMVSVFAEAVILKLGHKFEYPAIADALNAKYGTEYTAHDMQSCLNAASIKSKNAYIVHELKEMGYSAAKIASLLGIGVQTVYYHWRQYPKRPFFNLDLYFHSGKLLPQFTPEYENWRLRKGLSLNNM